MRRRHGREAALLPARTAVGAREIGAVRAHRDRAALRTAPDIEQRPLGFGRVVDELPALPGIVGRQDDLIVTDGEPVAAVEEAHAGEQCLYRDACRLRPARATIVGE